MLRHSFASGLIAQGTPITEVQEYLGHSDPVITLKVYSHWFKQLKTDAVARFATAVLAGNWTSFGHQTTADSKVAAVSS